MTRPEIPMPTPEELRAMLWADRALEARAIVEQYVADAEAKKLECIFPRELIDEVRAWTEHICEPEKYQAFYSGHRAAQAAYVSADQVRTIHDRVPRLATIRRWLLEQSPKSILDLGCFDGFGLLNVMAATGAAGVGVDLDADALTHAAKSAKTLGLQAVFLEAMLEDLDLPDKFDAVLLMEILEHVPNVKKALAVAEKHLAPGGRIYITVPASAVDHQGNAHEAREHLRVFTRESLVDAVGDRTVVAEAELKTTAHGERLMVYRRPKTAFYCNPVSGGWDPFKPETQGGSEEMIVGLAEALTDAGHDVEVFLNPSWESNVLSKKTPRGTDYQRHDAWHPEHERDIVIAVKWPPVTDMAVNARRVVFWSADPNKKEDFAGMRGERIDRYVALSEWHRKELEANGLPADKLVAIPLGVGKDVIGISPPIYRQPTRVVYASSFDRGLERLLDVWPEVMVAVPKAELHVWYGWELFDKVANKWPEATAWKARMEAKLAQPGVVMRGRATGADTVSMFTDAAIWAYPCIGGERFCVIGSTKIAVPGGEVEIRDLAGKDNVPVYCYDTKAKRITIRKARHVRKTMLLGEVWRVRYKWGTGASYREAELIATPDHPVMLRGGVYRELRDLKPGDRLMPFGRQERKAYPSIVMPDGSRVSEHRFVAEWKLGRPLRDDEHVHHLNGDTHDARPENLQALTGGDHTRTHLPNRDNQQLSRSLMAYYGTKAGRKLQSYKGRKTWSNPERVAEVLAARRERLFLQKPWKNPDTLLALHRRGMTVDAIAAYFSCSRTSVWKKLNSLGVSVPRVAGLDQPDALRRMYWDEMLSTPKIAERLGCSASSVRKALIRSGVPVRTLAESQAAKANHEVIAVEPCGFADVYNMEVDDCENFVANGIVVHNCLTAVKAQRLGAIPVVTLVMALHETVKHGLKCEQGEFVKALIFALKNPAWQEKVRGPMMADPKVCMGWDRVAVLWRDTWRDALHAVPALPPRRRPSLKQQSLSACLITLNSEAMLIRTLRSIKGLADEIIFADQGSTDRTLEIAKEYGVKVIEARSPHHCLVCDKVMPSQHFVESGHEPFGFEGPRNDSITPATGDWIMWLDSVTGETPVLVRKRGEPYVDLIEIRDLLPPSQRERQGLTYSRSDYETLSRSGWTPIRAIKQHWVSKPIYRIIDDGDVCVTGDHSLMSGGVEIAGRDVRPGTRSRPGTILDHIHAEKIDTGNVHPISEALAEVWGFFAAEGSCHVRDYKKPSTGSNKAEWTLSNTDRRLIDKYAAVLAAHHVRAFYVMECRNQNYAVVYKLGATDPTDLCAYYRSRFYSSAGRKKVPKEILNGDPTIISAFLRGYEAGDGHVRRHTKAGKPLQAFATNSPLLAAGLIFLYQRIGRDFYCNTQRNDKPHIVSCIERSGVSRTPGDGGNRRKIEGVRHVHIRKRFTGYVYDLNTADGTFTGGVGQFLLHNTDEELVRPENLNKYLRSNVFVGYAIKQHHFSIQPPNAFKPDLPVRCFRNGRGIRFFGKCLAGETLISTPAGPKPIADLVGQRPWLYCYDHKKKQISLAQAEWIGVTQRAAKLLEVELDDGTKIRATEEHPFLLRRAWKDVEPGSYVPAKDLKPGDRLMPFYRWQDGRVKDTRRGWRIAKRGTMLAVDEHVFVYQIVHGKIPAKHDVHHIDFNPANNDPSNLMLMPEGDHMRLHHLGKKVSADTCAKIAANHAPCNGLNNSMWGRTHSEDTRQKIGSKSRERGAGHGNSIQGWFTSERVREMNVSTWADPDIRQRRIEGIRRAKARQALERQMAAGNHKIVAVRDGGYADVYNIHMPGPNHNFIAGGVVVHNCHEHPELKMNDGIQPAVVLSDVDIAHDGYFVEDGRRTKFQRNIGLMHADRKFYAERLLGKFLWLRDLLHLTRYDLEASGGMLTPDARRRCEEAVALYENTFLAENNLYAMEGLDYYSEALRILNIGFDVVWMVGAAPHQAQPGEPRRARFSTVEHYKRALAAQADAAVAPFTGKYI